MSLPNIPNIDPDITIDSCHSINLLLSSIAMEEIALSHILNAEGEKLQKFIKMNPTKTEQYFIINKQVNNLLRSVIKSQLLLQLKLEEVSTLINSEFFTTCQEKYPCQPLNHCPHCQNCIHCQCPLCQHQTCPCHQSKKNKG